MAQRPGAFELIIGASVDPTFGPVILFGQGGVGVEAIGDTTLALPPLDHGTRPRHDRAHPNIANCCKGSAAGRR